MLFSEVKKLMREFNSNHNINRKCEVKTNLFGEKMYVKAKVIFKKGYFRKEFDDLYYREYTFTNYNKALTSSDLGYSIFAYNHNDDSLERIENCIDSDFESCEIIEVVE